MPWAATTRPQNIVHGAVLALREYPHISQLFLTGDTARIEAVLKKHACNDTRIEIVHTTQVVDMDGQRPRCGAEKKGQLRFARGGSREGRQGAGHRERRDTRARQSPHRSSSSAHSPAWIVPPSRPSCHRSASIGSSLTPAQTPTPQPPHLVQNAIMGAAYARHVLGRQNPEIGLMSNGTEEEKGDARCKETQDAACAMRRADRSISAATSRATTSGIDPPDVVVTDGFTGNILLKSPARRSRTRFLKW